MNATDRVVHTGPTFAICSLSAQKDTRMGVFLSKFFIFGQPEKQLTMAPTTAAAAAATATATATAAAATGTTTRKKKTPKWRNSHKKEVLWRDIVDYKEEGMDAEAVYEMHDGIYKKFLFNNFKTNLKNLRKAVEADRERMYQDSAAYYNDMSKTRPTKSQTNKPHWNTHVAKDLLEIDLDDDLHTLLEPMELWATRAEYQEFELEVFRKHIHQAVGARRKKAYWEDMNEQGNKAATIRGGRRS